MVKGILGNLVGLETADEFFVAHNFACCRHAVDAMLQECRLIFIQHPVAINRFHTAVDRPVILNREFRHDRMQEKVCKHLLLADKITVDLLQGCAEFFCVHQQELLIQSRLDATRPDGLRRSLKQ
jgi:hypothetical protein